MRALRPTAILFAALSLTYCGGSQPRPYHEDQLRRYQPVPACIVANPPRKSAGKAKVALREEHYWKFVFPTLEPAEKKLDPSMPVCTGDTVLAEPLLHDGKPIHGAWPAPIEEGDLVMGTGGDRMRALWFRSHRFDDGSKGGALALVRVGDERTEVFGVGALKSADPTVRLGVERLGNEFLVTALEDGCAGHAAGKPCDTILNLYIARRGVLARVAEIPLERIAYTDNWEPGMVGRMEYRLTSSVKFKPIGLQLFEQVKVLDEQGRVLRRAELERILVPSTEAKLTESEPPLWPRVFRTAPPAGKASAAPSGSAR